MKKESTLQKKLCLPFCRYYKPGKNEELKCRGYSVVDRLVRDGKIIFFERPDRRFDPARTEALVQALCRACPFEKEDCDFMQDRRLPPCGGYVVLARHVAAGVLSCDDINEA